MMTHFLCPRCTQEIVPHMVIALSAGTRREYYCARCGYRGHTITTDSTPEAVKDDPPAKPAVYTGRGYSAKRRAFERILNKR